MPAINYRNKAGQKLKGVTTILSLLNKPALIGWAYNRGKDGVPLYESRDKAASAGTLAHLYVEHHLKDLPEPSKDGYAPDEVEKAESCYIAFLEWEKAHQFKMVHSELSLVSESYQFGGTIDIGAIVNDLGIVDIKTSSDVYFTMRVQVAAYGVLWNEQFLTTPIKGYHILRLGDKGDFSHHYWPNLNAEWEVFKHLLAIQQIMDSNKFKL
jgi:hypothetical protein